MAYSDYGAFVYLNGERRTDKEDVGVYDTDEASLPAGLRVFANADGSTTQRRRRKANDVRRGSGVTRLRQ